MAQSYIAGKENPRIYLDFGGYYPRLIVIAKNLPERKYHATDKVWSVPATPYLAKLVLDRFGAQLKHHPDVSKLAENGVVKPSKVDAEKVRQAFPEFRDYQIKGVAFILAANNRALLADDMGLGKSPMSIAALGVRDNGGRYLVVAPANVIYKWKDEWERWWKGEPCSVSVVESKDDFDSRVCIISYDTLRRRVKELTGIKFEGIIFDECHYLKNNKAARTEAAKTIVSNAGSILSLSGTPFLNRPIEIFNTLNILRPIEWANYFQFGLRYCKGFKSAFGWDFTGKSNEAELVSRLKPIMLRRTKAEVLKELPPISRVRIPVKISGEHEKHYNSAVKDIISHLRETGGNWQRAQYAQTLVKINHLRHILGRGKAEIAIEWGQDFFEANPDEQLVFYCTHHDVVDSIFAAMSKVVKVDCITGSVPPKARQEIVKRFQSGEIKALIITEAGGEGINLFAASNILFVERNWTPAREEQAEARLHRMGQDDAVTAWYLIGPGFDQTFDRIVENKREVFRSIIGGDEVQTVVRELVASFFQEAE